MRSERAEAGAGEDVPNVIPAETPCYLARRGAGVLHFGAPGDDLVMPDEDRQPTGAPRYTTLRDYLRVLRERWLLIAACTLLGAAAGFAYSATQETVYEAQSTLNARQRSADIGLIGSTVGPPASPQSQTAELAARAERDSIAREVERSLDTSLSAQEIAAQVTSSIDAQTGLVLLTATDSDPEFAARLANVYSREVQREALRSERDLISEAITLVERQLKDTDIEKGALPSEVAILEERLNRLETLKGIVQPVEVVSAATVPGSPISPQPVRNTMLGLLAGLFLGIVVAYARDSLDTRLKTPREIEQHLGLTRVGQLTEPALGRSVRETNGTRRLDPIDLEGARIMRMNLDALDQDDSIRSLLVTSPLPGEGKSTVAMALAWASAAAGKLTLLVECDLRRPILAERLELRRAPGLTDAMVGRASPQEVLQPIDLDSADSGNGGVPESGSARLVCVTAGTPVADPAGILGSERFSNFLEEVCGVYERVILDSSPILSVVDTRELLGMVDGVVICARSYQTTRDQARATREALEGATIRVSGLVVTGVKRKDDDYSSYYQRYVGGLPGGSS